MPISGPPRTSSGLFGGPGFIVALLLLLGAGIFVAYQLIGGRMPRSGASLSLPGDIVVPSPPPPATSGGTAEQPTMLQPMPPLAEGSQSTAEPAPPLPEFDEDLSPAELLERYPPDPALSLDQDEAGDIQPGDADARRYRRPSSAPADAGRLALVATGLGIDRALTAQALIATPADVTLSFAARSDDLSGWIAAARAYGHEALVDLQLGTSGGGAADGDDRILRTELEPQENLRRLDAILAAAPRAAGVAISISDEFLGDAAALTPILQRLESGGWTMVGLPVTGTLIVAADRVVGQTLTAGGLSREILALKGLLRQRGSALVLATPEMAIALARNWLQMSANTTEQLPLVPASDLAEE